MNHNITEHYSGKIQNVSIMEWNIMDIAKNDEMLQNFTEYAKYTWKYTSIGVYLFSLFN